MNSAFWDKKYDKQEFHYGLKPNRFIALMLESRPPGRMLLVGAGEGRNAVYAASLGWEVHAIDISSTARDKALNLAASKGLKIQYTLEDASKFESDSKFDAIALFFAHFPPEIRQSIHQKLANYLKPVGELWLEAFAPGQLEFTSGGPKAVEMLYNPETLQKDFEALQIRQLEVKRYELDEGEGHQGLGEVIRLRAVR